MNIKLFLTNVLNYAKKVAKSIGLKKKPPVYGIRTSELSNFFSVLNNRGLSYVVLRQFEGLPQNLQGRRITILVSDADYLIIKKMCKGAKNTENYSLIDIFPVSNHDELISYYVPEFASRVLKGKIKNENGIWIPNQRDYFFGLSYHALYHEGYKSGIPSKYRWKELYKRDDYNQELLALAKTNGIILNTGFSMEDLEVVLHQNDWRPPIDVYYRLSKDNQWAYDRVQELTIPEWRHNQGTSVFFIREKAYLYIINDLYELLRSHNVEIINEYTLTDSQARYVMSKTRGGDWGELIPYRKSLGLATHVIITKKEGYDLNLFEETPTGDVLYIWIKEIKEYIRKQYLAKYQKGEDVHILHTSDNGVDAAYYINIVMQAINKIQ